VSIAGQSAIADELYENASPTGEPVHTDKDGRFQIEGVVPNLKFWVRVQDKRTLFVSPNLDDKMIRAAETLDLGAVHVKRPG